MSCHLVFKLHYGEWEKGNKAMWAWNQGGQWVQWEGLKSVLKVKHTRSPADGVWVQES